jgi:ferredoxin/coenzyme F420-reducing hydrogenase delta subunit
LAAELSSGTALAVGAVAPKAAAPAHCQPTPFGVESPLDPEVRGAAALRRGERVFLALDRLLARALPEPWNPFLQTGAIAITSILVATVTGIVLLIWYRPSVHQAYASLATLSPLGGGLLRSLHRYSSDAAMFFVLVHALRIILERRFTGPRWLAWVTGIVGLGVLWFVGWTGYWLVWDLRGQLVAVGTAHVLDALPIFADPMGRSLLTDSSVNSLLFFVVFFIHMLVPLALALALWLHITRLARPRFLTGRPLTIWTFAVLVALSLAYPAQNAERARMTALAPRFTMDWWYLAPLALTDRLGGGALWSLTLFGSVGIGSVPWWTRRRRRPAAFVTTIRCNACGQCYQDCPYNAIAMVPRTDSRVHLYAEQAEVDVAKCVGCGICVASCSSIGTDLREFGLAAERARLEAQLKQAVASGEAVRVLFLCAESGAGTLRFDPVTGRCPTLPGWRVFAVPCAGWLHSLSIARLLERGAAGVAIASCGAGTCHYREGDRWLRERLAGSRALELEPEIARGDRVLLLDVAGLSQRSLVRALERFAAEGAAAARRQSSLGRRWLAGVASAGLAVLVAAVLGLVSDLGYAAPRILGSELVVSLKHPGEVSEHCHTLSDEEKAALPAHMRRDKVCDRRRADVRLRVEIDGQRMVDRSYAPAGIWGDGNSIAVERIPVSPGEHRIEVAIGQTHDSNEWSFEGEQTLSFSEDARRVVTFDRLAGFGWN